VGRSLTAFVACLSLIAAGFTAPLMHVHDDAEAHGGHHGGRLVHAHGGSHGHVHDTGSGEPTVEPGGAEPEFARALNVFHMTTAWSQDDVAAPPAAQGPPAPAERAMVVRPPVPHGHDPPDLRLSAPRAPPALLS
jgi:hypothetical protein